MAGIKIRRKKMLYSYIYVYTSIFWLHNFRKSVTYHFNLKNVFPSCTYPTNVRYVLLSQFEDSLTLTSYDGVTHRKLCSRWRLSRLLSIMQIASVVIYCHLWTVRLHHIFPHYLLNGMIFGGGGRGRGSGGRGRKVLEQKNVCFDFLHNLCLKHFSR